jgi:hypothetical protein
VFDRATDLAQATGRVSGGGDIEFQIGAGAIGHLAGSGLRESDTAIFFKMFFRATGAVAFAGFVVALAGEFVASADTIAITGGGSCLDRD